MSVLIKYSAGLASAVSAAPERLRHFKNTEE